jgi:hypothetical protein
MEREITKKNATEIEVSKESKQTISLISLKAQKEGVEKTIAMFKKELEELNFTINKAEELGVVEKEEEEKEPLDFLLKERGEE